MTLNNKNLDIQALRAVAIIMVILQHYRNRLPSPDWYLGSFNYVNYWAGVDIFLSISGYLMAKSLTGEIKKTGRTTKTFLLFLSKRIFRLAPCLLVWGTICIIISYFMQPSWGVSPLKSFTTLYTSLLGYSNIHFYRCAVTANDCDQMNAVTWSLSLEWQLYAIIAAIMLLFNRKNLTIIFIFIVAIASFLPVTQMYYQSIGWWIRPQAFFLGAIIFITGSKCYVSNKCTRLFFIIVCIFVLLVAPQHFNYRLTLPAIGFAGALLFLCFISGGVVDKKDNPAYKMLDWIGDRSYSIYLCHLPLLHVTREVLNKLSLNTVIYENKVIYFFAFILLLVVFSDLSYRYVEKKFIRTGRLIMSKNISPL